MLRPIGCTDFCPIALPRVFFVDRSHFRSQLRVLSAAAPPTVHPLVRHNCHLRLGEIAPTAAEADRKDDVMMTTAVLSIAWLTVVMLCVIATVDYRTIQK